MIYGWVNRVTEWKRARVAVEGEGDYELTTGLDHVKAVERGPKSHHTHSEPVREGGEREGERGMTEGERANGWMERKRRGEKGQRERKRGRGGREVCKR